MPIIASTATANLDSIDRVVSFFIHRDKNLTLMHCIGEYPTDINNFQLNQIDLLRNRYKDLQIGFSTHEDPNEVLAVQLAISKGVSILEKHIGIETDKYKLNLYSSTPKHLKKWLDSAVNAIGMCGTDSSLRYSPTQKEYIDVCQFKRGVYLKNNIESGNIIDRDNVYYAFPSLNNNTSHVLANDMSKYVKFIALTNMTKDDPLLWSNVNIIDSRKEALFDIGKVKKLLKESGVVCPGHSYFELSHHYGIENFDRFGVTMIEIINSINREYCKKLIIVLPGQKHPEQYHKKKEETFMILFGKLNLKLDGVPYLLKKGDIKTIEVNQKHEFESAFGCILEEISSTHYVDDSYYTDEKIMQNTNRKTKINYWL